MKNNNVVKIDVSNSNMLLKFKKHKKNILLSLVTLFSIGLFISGCTKKPESPVLKTLPDKTASSENKNEVASMVNGDTAAASLIGDTLNHDTVVVPKEIIDSLKEAQYILINAVKSNLNGFWKVTVKQQDMKDKSLTLNITMSNDGKYFFNDNAQLVEVRTGSVVNEVSTEIVLDSVKPYIGVGFDAQKTFSIIHGKPIRKLAVFTDPDCPYCKQLETLLNKVDNVEITYIYFPVTQLHPDAENKVNKLWSQPASQRGEIWKKYLETGVIPEASTKDKYDYNYSNKVAKDFNVHGTPTLFNIISGKIQVGTPTTQKQLEDFLNTGLSEEALKELPKP